MLVAQRPLELAVHRAADERGEGHALVGIEAVDGPNHGEKRGLAQVVDRDAAGPVARREPVGEPAVLLHDLVAEPAVTGPVVLAEQLVAVTAVTAVTSGRRRSERRGARGLVAGRGRRAVVPGEIACHM